MFIIFINDGLAHLGDEQGDRVVGNTEDILQILVRIVSDHVAQSDGQL